MLVCELEPIWASSDNLLHRLVQSMQKIVCYDFFRTLRFYANTNYWDKTENYCLLFAECTLSFYANTKQTENCKQRKMADFAEQKIYEKDVITIFECKDFFSAITQNLLKAYNWLLCTPVDCWTSRFLESSELPIMIWPKKNPCLRPTQIFKSI